MKNTCRLSLLALLLLTACGTAPTYPIITPEPLNASVIDAMHGGENSHFFFLPPMVPDPLVTGEFNHSASPVVEICEWTGSESVPLSPPAIFTLEGGPGSTAVQVDEEEEHYLVNWHTDRFDLDPDRTYRIKVSVGGDELGHADVDVVSSGRELKNVNTGEYVPLKDGRTLPIKFRIEREVVNGWYTLAPMPTARRGHAVVPFDGKLYVIGGDAGGVRVLSTVEIYDPLTDNWSTGSPMPTARSGMGAVGMNGKIYTIGGTTRSTFENSTVEIYDPATDSWEAGIPMPTARTALMAATVDGKLFAMNGFIRTQITLLEIFDPVTATWSSGTSMPTVRSGAGFGVIDGKIYVAGGIHSHTVHLNVLEVYDPASDSWVTQYPLPTDRAGVASGVMNGRLFVTGVFSGFTGTIMHAYDPSNDSWNTLPGFPTPRSGAVNFGGAIGNGFYVVGGEGPGYVMSNTLEMYPDY